MGFGSYDESEQEQANDNQEVSGEDVTADFNEANHSGSEGVVDTSATEMMDHL